MSFDLVKMTEEIQLELDSSRVMLPDSYSVTNAMKAAYLVLRETVDKNKQPVLSTCSHESIYYALLNMAVQGLNPIKDQCYFVAFGSRLVCMRGYMGSAMIAKRVEPRIADIRAEAIYEGDKFQFEIINGRKLIKSHEQELTNMHRDRIIGAYAVALDSEDKILFTDIMTMAEIEQSWHQSSKFVFDDKGNINQKTTHYKFKAEMCKRTVIQRLCKPIINQSSDGALLQAALNTDEEDGMEHSINTEVSEKANTKQIDFKPAEPVLREPAMATKGHAKVIYDLSLQLNHSKEMMIENISSFVGRKIEKFSELTESEADSYIEILEHQITSLEQDQPDWV